MHRGDLVALVADVRQFKSYISWRYYALNILVRVSNKDKSYRHLRISLSAWNALRQRVPSPIGLFLT